MDLTDPAIPADPARAIPLESVQLSILSNGARQCFTLRRGLRMFLARWRAICAMWLLSFMLSAWGAPADLDRDGDVDQDDFAIYQRCYSGANVAQNDPACQVARVDDDADVDLTDLQQIENCASG